MDIQTKSTKPTAVSLQQIVADANGALPTKVMILRAGHFPTSKYGKMDISTADLLEMKSNFDGGLGLSGGGSAGAPINFGHNFGDKAAGWIKGLEVEGDALYASPVEWSTAGDAALKGGEYKFFSAEFFLKSLGQKWSNPEDETQSATNVVDGGALTNIPLFPGLMPVMADNGKGQGDSLEIFVKASALKESNMPTLEQVRAKESDQLTEEDKKVLTDNQADLTDDEKKKFGLEVIPAGGGNQDENKNKEGANVTVDQATPVTASAVRGDEGKVVMAAKEVVELRDKAAKAEADNKTLEDLKKTVASHEADKVKEQVKVHAARGAIKADQIDKWTERIVADASNKELLENLPDNAAMASEQGSEAAAEAISANDEKLHNMVVAARQKEFKDNGQSRSYADTRSAILKEHPELKPEENKE